MELTKENILRKTHYGLNIFSHVLREYYPDETVLSVKGRDCLPARNPFNDNKETLMIKVVDGCAVFEDSELSDFKGDAFDFASRHFNLKESALLEKLNDFLFLRLGEPLHFLVGVTMPETPEFSSALQKPSTKFSFFKAPVSNTIPNGAFNIPEIYKLIVGTVYQERTLHLRSLSDKKESRQFKASNFDYVTFSGTFTERSDKALKKHSGLICIDFDHIHNLDELRKALIEDEYFDTELLFISPSGDGIKWIIPVDLTKASHHQYFKAISNYLSQYYKVDIDQSGKDVSRACFLAFDPQAFLNPKYV